MFKRPMRLPGRRPPLDPGHIIVPPQQPQTPKSLTLNTLAALDLFELVPEVKVTKAQSYNSPRIDRTSEDTLTQLQGMAEPGTVREFWPAGMELEAIVECSGRPKDPLIQFVERQERGASVQELVESHLNLWNVGFVQCNVRGKRSATYDTKGHPRRTTVEISLQNPAWDGSHFPFYVRPESLSCEPRSQNLPLQGDHWSFWARVYLSDRPTTILPLRLTGGKYLTKYCIREEFFSWICLKSPAGNISCIHHFNWICEAQIQMTGAGNVLHAVSTTKVLSHGPGTGYRSPVMDGGGPRTNVVIKHF